MHTHTIVFIAITFLHNLFPAVWIGGLITLGFNLMPSMKQVLGKKPEMKNLAEQGFGQEAGAGKPVKNTAALLMFSNAGVGVVVLLLSSILAALTYRTADRTSQILFFSLEKASRMLHSLLCRLHEAVWIMLTGGCI